MVNFRAKPRMILGGRVGIDNQSGAGARRAELFEQMMSTLQDALNSAAQEKAGYAGA
jgi:hypothetical protein